MKKYEELYQEPHSKWLSEIASELVILHNKHNGKYEPRDGMNPAMDFLLSDKNIHNIANIISEIWRNDEPSGYVWAQINDIDITYYDHHILRESFKRGFNNIKIISDWYVEHNRKIELVKIMKSEGIDYRDFLKE